MQIQMAPNMNNVPDQLRIIADRVQKGEQPKETVRTLQKNLKKPNSSNPSEDEIEQILLAKGLISEIPKRSKDKDEETYEPIEVIGKPLSETILEERE